MVKCDKCGGPTSSLHVALDFEDGVICASCSRSKWSKVLDSMEYWSKYDRCELGEELSTQTVH